MACFQVGVGSSYHYVAHQSAHLCQVKPVRHLVNVAVHGSGFVLTCLVATSKLLLMRSASKYDKLLIATTILANPKGLK